MRYLPAALFVIVALQMVGFKFPRLIGRYVWFIANAATLYMLWPSVKKHF